ncbi:hypothetical protein CI109_102572 [Kwoniella shandongensis]|uniref:Uncharacterized protein n=1 Tax=Kwoniella shandongensis TaxID=1734106 RepID=A0A5M6BXQ4_9TREE|nr:uncharacterized protein CI109_005811 [Kwoniella shandongensis]KAA5525789.1 hypothetical protein CI109_005811 [Kwoniella shandongensis]
MSDKLALPTRPPAVLILGGTTTIARALCLYLLDPKTPRASFVRLADRYSVSPPTTYLDRPFLSLLNDPSSSLEYKQINLGNVERHDEVFTPPKNWKEKELELGEGREGFDVVFDLTGDTSFDKPELIQITHTYQLALSLATTASTLPSSLKPRAYIRLTFPFYEMKSLPSSSSAGHTESAELKPDGIRGKWWHETLRGIGRLEGLNFGVIRCGAWYGRGTWDGETLPRVVVGHVYQYLKEEMKFLYNSDLRVNTIHSLDVSQALHLLSLYLLSTPRETVLSQSASPIGFSFPSSSSSSSSTFSLTKHKRSASSSETWKTISTVVPEKGKVAIPLFNIVDEGDSTQGSLAKAVAEVWGIKFGFLNNTMATLVQQFAKTDFAEMVEDVNEMHVQAWSDMLSKSNPPIDSSPITPFLDEHAFRKMAICFDGSKAKKILGFKPAYSKVEVDELKRIVHDFQDDRLWPKLA